MRQSEKFAIYWMCFSAINGIVVGIAVGISKEDPVAGILLGLLVAVFLDTIRCVTQHIERTVNGPLDEGLGFPGPGYHNQPSLPNRWREEPTEEPEKPQSKWGGEWWYWLGASIAAGVLMGLLMGTTEGIVAALLMVSTLLVAGRQVGQVEVHLLDEEITSLPSLPALPLWHGSPASEK
jgi:hypothetical protein